MNVEARLAVATGAAGLGAGALVIAQRAPGSIPMLIVLAVAARAAGAFLARDATDAEPVFRRQAVLGMAWILAGAAASFRAGSAIVGDVAGAHAVAGVSLVRGPVLTIVGCWVALLACAAAISSSALPAGLGKAHSTATRLSVLGGVLQAATAAALFAGPQFRTWKDAIPWVGCAVGVLLASYGLRLGGRARTISAFALAAVGLTLVLFGGRP